MVWGLFALWGLVGENIRVTNGRHTVGEVGATVGLNSDLHRLAGRANLNRSDGAGHNFVTDFETGLGYRLRVHLLAFRRCFPYKTNNTLA